MRCLEPTTSRLTDEAVSARALLLIETGVKFFMVVRRVERELNRMDPTV